MARQSSQPLVLEYKKRRFDGGSEREIIEQIEYQKRLIEQQKVQAAAAQQAAAAGVQSPLAAAQAQAQAHAQAHAPQVNKREAQAKTKMSMKEKMYKAFIVPYVELILGMSGVLIGYLMIYSMFKSSIFSAEVMRQERDALLYHSWQVIKSSIKQIICSPFTAVKLCVS